MGQLEQPLKQALLLVTVRLIFQLVEVEKRLACQRGMTMEQVPLAA
jgi:hypothetical protein